MAPLNWLANLQKICKGKEKNDQKKKLNQGSNNHQVFKQFNVQQLKGPFIRLHVLIVSGSSVGIPVLG